MAVFRFVGTMADREEREERGTVLARDEQEARKKLEPFRFDRLRLKKLSGLTGFFKAFNPDVR